MADVNPRHRGLPSLLLVAGAVALTVIAWSAARLSTTHHLDVDGFGQLQGAPDPDASVLEEQLAWALEMVNGRLVDDDEFEQRFSRFFRSQISAQDFRDQTRFIRTSAPFRLYGFEIETPEPDGTSLDSRPFAQAALLGADDKAYVLVVTQAVEDEALLDGLLITDVDSDRGAFTGWQFLVHAGASVALLVGAGLLLQFGVSRRWLGNRTTTLVVVAGALWSLQLLELSDSPVVFTAALAAGPMAAAVLGLAVVGSTGPFDDRPTAQRLRLLGLVAVAVAGMAALAALTAIDTAGIGRPDNLLAIGPDRSTAQTLTAVTGGLTLLALATVAGLVVYRQFNLARAKGRGQVPTTVGVLVACGLVGAAAWGSVAGSEGYDLSQSPLLSIGAVAVILGLVGTGFWYRYDEGERADELAQENELLQQELAVQLAEVEASRSRILQAAEEARRGIERDLHDGAQQRLVALLLAIQVGRERFGHLQVELDEFLASAADDLGVAVAELRELARGLRPAVLERGIAAAAEALAEVSSVPVTVEAESLPRCSPTVEQTAYYVISESLTNAARHAEAEHIQVTISAVEPDDASGAPSGGIRCSIVDDGRGGAAVDRGHGLQNIQDRVQAIGGRWTLSSPVGGPTAVVVTLPWARAEAGRS